MMKLFSIDLHASIAADVRHILSLIYKKEIQVERWCLSSHHWMLGEKFKSQQERGINIWTNLSEENIEHFQKKYDTYLSTFDGFIVTHGIGLCLLF